MLKYIKIAQQVQKFINGYPIGGVASGSVSAQPASRLVIKSFIYDKGDVGNAIVNTESKTASAIFFASNVPTGVFLLP